MSSEITNKHSVIIHFWYGSDNWDTYYELSKKKGRIVEETGVGEYDGHEMNMDGTDGSYYLYGSIAEALFKTVKPVLEEYAFIKGAKAHLRFGGINEDASEIEIEL